MIYPHCVLQRKKREAFLASGASTYSYDEILVLYKNGVPSYSLIKQSKVEQDGTKSFVTYGFVKYNATSTENFTEGFDVGGEDIRGSDAKTTRLNLRVLVGDNEKDSLGVQTTGGSKTFQESSIKDPDKEIKNVTVTVSGKEKGSQLQFSHSFDEILGNGIRAIHIYRNGVRDTSLEALAVGKGNSLSLPEVGEYRVLVESAEAYAGGTYAEKEFYVIDSSQFTASITRESLDYSIKFPTSMAQLVANNGGENFLVEVYYGNTKLFSKTVSSSSSDEIPIKQGLIPSNVDLGDYASVRIRFSSGSTGLDKSLNNVEVPAFADVGQLVGVMTNQEKGEIELRANGQAITGAEILRSYGQKSGNPYKAMVAKLFTKGSNISIGTDTIRNDNKNAVLTFSNTFFSGFMNQDSESRKSTIQANMNKYNDLKNFFQSVREGGSAGFELRCYPPMGESLLMTVPVTNVSIEGFFGISESEIDALIQEIDAVMNENIVEFSGDYIEVPYGEVVQFTVPDSGSYYFYDVRGGVQGNGISIEMPTDSGNIVLARAGRATGETIDDKRVGEYMYYNPLKKEITYTSEAAMANCYPLAKDAVYQIYGIEPDGMKLAYIKVSNELTEIINESASSQGIAGQSQNIVGGRTEVGVAYILADEDTGLFRSLEEMLASFVRALANGLNYLVQWSLQSVGGSSSAAAVDMDSIIFNHYPDTSVNFFRNSSSSVQTSYLVGLFRDGVDHWFTVFQAIAIAGYAAMFLYMGVKMLFRVGSSKQNSYKQLLIDWVAGILILFFFPYAIKYAIDVNNGLVSQIEKSKSQFIQAETRSTANLSNFSLPEGAEEDEYESLAAQMDVNPFDSEGGSYMALMAARAEATKRLTDAIVYLIMTIQFIILAILYYKRVFVIAFLIVIFPLVALSYAFDKVGDGHAGAFETWCKEIMTNIFVQSIHALVYVFVMGAVYASSSSSNDWLLAIVGISFLFQGEQVLKKLVGQEGNTAKSLAETATRTMATVTAARVVTKNIADNVIGASSHLGRTVNYYRKWQTEKKISRNMDVLTSRPPLPTSEPTTFNPSLFQGPDDPAEKQELADAMAIINHPEAVDPEQWANAMKTLMKQDPAFVGTMNGLNLANAQLDAMRNVIMSTTYQLLDGDRSTAEKRSALKERIDQELEIRLQAIFPDGDVKFYKRAVYFMLRDGDDQWKHKVRSTDRREVKEEMQQAETAKNQIVNQIVLASKGMDGIFSNEAKPTKMSHSAQATKDSVLSSYYQVEKTGSYSNSNQKMAESIGVLNDVASLSNPNRTVTTKYTAHQVWEAASYVERHEKDSKQNQRAVQNTLGANAKAVKAVVAEQIGREYTDTGDDSPVMFRDHLTAIPHPKQVEITGASSEEEKKEARGNLERTYRQAMQQIKAEDDKAGDNLYYPESLDKFDVKDILRKERLQKGPGYDDAYVDYLVEERKAQNEEETNIIEDLARELLDDTPEYTRQTYEGLTKSEHEEYSKALRGRFMEEMARTGTTMTGVVLGGAIGAAAAIAVGDEDPAFKEALAGGAAGALVGDQLAELAMGKEKQKPKTIRVINPYTREVESIHLEEWGITGGGAGLELIEDNEIVHVSDSRLGGELSYELNQKFLENKQTADTKQAMNRRKDLYGEALRRSKGSNQNNQ